MEVRTNTLVTRIAPGRVWVGDMELPADVTLWAAGVAASPLGRQLGVPTDRSGRVVVDANLNIPAHAEVFVIGDLAAAHQDGKLLPGVAPVAIQQGQWVAGHIARLVAGEVTQPFRYREKGNLATIGRAAAVAEFGRLHISGVTAWLLWLVVHIMYLIGFRNRAIVLLEWGWAYLRRQSGIRLITGSTELPGS